MPKAARVTGWGKYLPSRVVTNHELEDTLDTTDEWIRTRTGIKERRLAASHETTSSMATMAASQALASAGMEPQDLDLVLVATCTPEHLLPASASVVQNALGARRAAAFDLNAACSGFVYALATAYQFIAAGNFENILVVGSEIYSRILNWKDRSTSILFGDGAGAVLLQAQDGEPGLLSFILGSDGSRANLLYVPGPAGATEAGRNGFYLSMKGAEVFKFAVKAMCQASRKAVEAANLSLSDIELVIPHQANYRISQAAAHSLGIPLERFFSNVERYGNTSSASIPIALCEALEEGRVRPGDHLLMVGFGGGLSWGALVWKW
ncbi:MAG: ketoacyl-ACP synthase III [Chloroflexi bacterium]|nr:ketoacyl-ACP synthase III [Chloroflexota bacterium]